MIECYHFTSLSYKDQGQHDQKQLLRPKFIRNYIIVMCIEIQPHHIHSIESNRGIRFESYISKMILNFKLKNISQYFINNNHDLFLVFLT